MHCEHKLPLELWQGTHKEKSISLTELENDFSQGKNHSDKCDVGKTCPEVREKGLEA